VTYDAVVVGAGPNGLAAAIELARNGLSVLLREAGPTIGGAARTEALTLPGFLHDVGSAVYPMGIGSPFFRTLPLADHGLEWIHSPVPVAHPLLHGRAVVLERSPVETAQALGADGAAYRRLVEPFVRRWSTFADHIMTTPFRPPRDPVLMGRFGLRAIQSTTRLAARFRTEEARALLAGNAAHAAVPLENAPSAAIGVVLMVAAHAVGWPVPRGGAGALTRALASLLRSLGGTIETDAPVTDLSELPPARALILALTNRQVASVAGDRLPRGYRTALERWRYGPGAYKVDWALDGPIPWEAADCARAITVHVGGTLEEIAEAERAPWHGRVAKRPFLLVVQPSVFDATRAPAGKHTAWAYCHVPNGWGGSATEAMEAQIERFAPGFRELVLARRVHTPADLEAWDANLVGGDVNGGAATMYQTFGPGRWRRSAWSTPIRKLYVCSASTPPGGGVHGMCGYHAARAALKRTFRM
jgi:phytoene dehydrogenase-like protein